MSAGWPPDTIGEFLVVVLILAVACFLLSRGPLLFLAWKLGGRLLLLGAVLFVVSLVVSSDVLGLVAVGTLGASAILLIVSGIDFLVFAINDAINARKVTKPKTPLEPDGSMGDGSSPGGGGDTGGGGGR